MLGPHQQTYVNELRHGGHKQTRHYLQDDGCYCALGVACVALESEGTTVRRIDSLLLDGYRQLEIAGQDLGDQPQVLAALGLRNEVGEPDHCPLSRNMLVNTIDDVQLLKIHAMRSVRARACVQSPTRPDECSITLLNDFYELTFTEIADVITEFSHLYFIEPR